MVKSYWGLDALNRPYPPLWMFGWEVKIKNPRSLLRRPGVGMLKFSQWDGR